LKIQVEVAAEAVSDFGRLPFSGVIAELKNTFSIAEFFFIKFIFLMIFGGERKLVLQVKTDLLVDLPTAQRAVQTPIDVVVRFVADAI
jgi:hypothetical protein